MENKRVAVIAALISAFFAFLSWRCASLTWEYNRELSRPAISLVDVKVNGERVGKDKLKINFLFLFKNVGKETLRINELLIGHVDFQNSIFERLDKKVILNPIHPEAIFNYGISFLININPEITNEEVGRILPSRIGKHAIILTLKYKGTSVFSKKEIIEKYFLGYQGFGAVYQLEEQEYKGIEQILPKEFRINDVR